MERAARIVLIGFSGTGKTTVARLIAERLRWDVVDLDDEIEQRWGVPIPAIFAKHGEAAFRASERTVLGEALARDRVVIATGGGAVEEADTWSGAFLGRVGTLVIALDASPETIWSRLKAQTSEQGGTVERPMLTGDDPLARIRALKEQRQGAYDKADLTISGEGIRPADVAAEILDVVGLLDGYPLRVHLRAASADSEISVAPGLLGALGESLRRRWPKAQRAWVITDAHVGPLHGSAVTRSLNEAGISSEFCTVAAGEGSKSLATAGDLYSWMLGNGIERGDVVIALGGGVVGDLAGFVAATVLRGVGLIQAPTSLLAAVDSSVGGKTGINHPAGKNLIGAFLQPPLVVVDPSLLQTLPARELRSGWAEVVKHAVIQRSTPEGERGDLAAVLDRNAEHLKRLAEPATSYVIWRNIRLKAAVVAADERESGVRAYLNFGHTLGHAIEAANYEHLHGEAVAIGMCAASELGRLHGTCSAEEVVRIRNLIAQFELPMSTAVDEDRVHSLLQRDKKRIAGRQRFVLPLDGGGVTISDDVAETTVALALAGVTTQAALA